MKKDRVTRFASVGLLCAGLALSPPETLASLGNDTSVEHEISSAVPVTEFSQYGNILSWGGLSKTDEGQPILDSQTLIDIALARHSRMEQAFGKRLNMNLDLISLHPNFDGTAMLFNENTGSVINEFITRVDQESIHANVSINITPGPGSTAEQINFYLERIFTGQMPGLPNEILKNNINDISISLDLEQMVLGIPGETHFVSNSLINEVNAYYIQLHQTLQIQHFGVNIPGIIQIPTLTIYDFGVTSADNMTFEDVHLDPNIRVTLDTIGTLDDKSTSADNLSRVYQRPVNMMFFLPASPHLTQGTQEADEGISPWDYSTVAEWAEQNSRGTVIAVQ